MPNLLRFRLCLQGPGMAWYLISPGMAISRPVLRETPGVGYFASGCRTQRTQQADDGLCLTKKLHSCFNVTRMDLQ